MIQTLRAPLRYLNGTLEVRWRISAQSHQVRRKPLIVDLARVPRHELSSQLAQRTAPRLLSASAPQRNEPSAAVLGHSIVEQLVLGESPVSNDGMVGIHDKHEAEGGGQEVSRGSDPEERCVTNIADHIGGCCCDVGDRPGGAVRRPIGLVKAFSSAVLPPFVSDRQENDEDGAGKGKDRTNRALNKAQPGIVGPGVQCGHRRDLALDGNGAQGESDTRSHRPDSGAGEPAGVVGSRVAAGHHVVTRSALDASRRRADGEAQGRRHWVPRTAGKGPAWGTDKAPGWNRASCGAIEWFLAMMLADQVRRRVVSEVADLLRAVTSLLWVGVGVTALILLGRVLVARSGSLRTLGLGPTGLTMEFVEAKVDQAIKVTSQESSARVGQAAKRSVVDRLQHHADLLAEARILWVDDHPENNTPVVELLRSFGAVVDTPGSNVEALALLSGARYDVVISDVGRDDEGPGSDLKGVELAEQVYARWGKPIILFTVRFNPATLPGMSAQDRLRLVDEMTRSVFGRTNRMDIVLHLIMDVLERQ